MWEETRLKKLFGSNAYAKVLGPLKKLDDRSEKFIFLGYAPNGYRLWNPRKRKIVISRDVKFEERNNEWENKIEKVNIKVTKGDEEENEEQRTQGQNEEEEDSENTMSEYEEVEEQSEHEEEEEKQIPRRSTRERTIPKKYRDYVYLTYQQAVTGEERNKWKQAIKEEQISHDKNKTWELVDRVEAGEKRFSRVDGSSKGRIMDSTKQD